MIKILALLASPRRGGNSEILLDNFVKGAVSASGSSKKILLNNLRFKSALIDIDRADIVVIASPIFFGSIPGQFKMMIDRLQPLWLKKEILKKPPLTVKKRIGVFLCVSGSKRTDFFENAKKLVRIFFAVLDIEYAGDIYCGGMETKGEIKKEKDMLKKARELGKSLVKTF